MPCEFPAWTGSTDMALHEHRGVWGSSVAAQRLSTLGAPCSSRASLLCFFLRREFGNELNVSNNF